MKKRLLSCILAGLVVLSAFPVMAEENADAVEAAVEEAGEAVEEAAEEAGEAVEEVADAAEEIAGEAEAAVDDALDAGEDGTQDPAAEAADDALDAGPDGTQDPAGDPEGTEYALDAGPDGTQDPDGLTEEEMAALAKEEAAKLEIPGTNGIKETEIKVESRGYKLDGRMVVPDTGKDKYPFVVLTHGFTADFHDMDNIAEALGKNGIASVRVSLTGSGDSEGLYEDTTLTTQKEDILNVLAYVKGLDIADTNNLFLCGKSQGGLGSALAAAECKDDINALCLWFPAFCIPDDFRSGRVMFTEFDLNDIPEKVEIFEGYAVGKAMIEENLAMDPYALVSSFAKDVLIIHGDKDSIVNYSYSEKLNETYAHSELVTIKDGDHGFQGDNELYALDQTVKFIQAHLAGEDKAEAAEKSEKKTEKASETASEVGTPATTEMAPETASETGTPATTEAVAEAASEDDAEETSEEAAEAGTEEAAEETTAEAEEEAAAETETE